MALGVPRYIVFAVSGLIDSPAHLVSDDVTIAGQTSPGGVIIRGFHTTEEPYCGDDPVCIGSAATAQNWILRFVRLRPGDTPGGLDDGLRLLHTREAIVDHVSIANATDEAVQISYSSDITIQASMLAETIGDHASFGGMLLNYSDPGGGWPLDRLSIHHTIWNRIEGRMPEISRESSAAAGAVMQLELSNNLLWDPGYFIDVSHETFPYGPLPSQPVWYQLNWVGNRAHPRQGFPYGLMALPDPQAPNQTTTYVGDNRLDTSPGIEDYQLMYCCNDFPPEPLPPDPPFAQSERHPFPTITYDGAEVLARVLARSAGARPLDPMDRRLVGAIEAEAIDLVPRDQNPAGDIYTLDFLSSSPPAPPLDSDLDGMPDAWEIRHGLDPQGQDHDGRELSVLLLGAPGYDNLECYLAELAERAARTIFADGFELGDTSRWTAQI